MVWISSSGQLRRLSVRGHLDRGVHRSRSGPPRPWCALPHLLWATLAVVSMIAVGHEAIWTTLVILSHVGYLGHVGQWASSWNAAAVRPECRPGLAQTDAAQHGDHL